MALELYTLTPLWQRNVIIDRFTELIWTERWNDLGDFELHLASTPQNRSIFVKGAYLALNKSMYTMRVESIENDQNADGTNDFIVKGTSIEGILKSRVAKESTDDLTTSPQWVITNPPADIARQLFSDICITGILDEGDILPGVSTDWWPSEPSIAEPADAITVSLDPMLLFDALATNVCVPYDLGFRMLRDDSTGTFYFNIYTGDDRTTSQTDLPAVIFSPTLDSLMNTKELTTITTAMSGAYVFSPAGFEPVFPDGVDPTISGFDRRIMYVDGSSVTSDNPDIPDALIQVGNEALAGARIQQTFDGVVSPDSPYVYGVDYFLGDLVSQQNSDGEAEEMRVTEQIFSQNGDGETSYPTLALFEFIEVGTWASYSGSATAWADFSADTTSVWGNQP